MNSNYIENGAVRRDKIAMDIKYGRLDRAAIESLCDNPQIKAAFFGTNYADKKPRGLWNKEYLDLLSYAVVAESFNRDYLLHLNEVAEYVAKPTGRKLIERVKSAGNMRYNAKDVSAFRKILAAIVIALIVAGLIFLAIRVLMGGIAAIVSVVALAGVKAV